MASKKGGKCKRSYYRARPVNNIEACVFCRRVVDDEIIYGKLYAIGDIQCHYFCALLSCCLIQKGNDEEGLFGFLYPDILAEVERSKKHKCSYCNREGANLGCSVSQCRKQFHLPCGRERDSLSLFHGNYKSFCANHAPKQKIIDSVMPNVKMRIAKQRRLQESRNGKKLKPTESGAIEDSVAQIVCVICYEEVEGFPTPRTFWPPCCAKDAWFHRSCLQRMALSAGLHYLKCPLCNDKDDFYKAVVSQGYYVPDRDAAWELEQNAFAEIYERPVACGAEVCGCPMGREHDSDAGLWDITLCILCGSTAIHAGCTDGTEELVNVYICKICKPAAPGDLEKLIASIEKVQQQEQAEETVRHGPVMPSRMSLRRTKRRSCLNTGPSSSQNLSQYHDDVKVKTEVSRLELNLKKPTRRTLEPVMRTVETGFLSPTKILEQTFRERIGRTDVAVDSSKVLQKLREKLRKPMPMVAKKRIVNTLLDELLNNTLLEPKSKDALREWNSPKKIFDIKFEHSKENIEVGTPKKSSAKEKSLCDDNEVIEANSLKSISLQYTNIAPKKEGVYENSDFKCNFTHKHIENSSEGSRLRTAIDFAMDGDKGNKRKVSAERQISVEDPVPSKKRRFDCSLKRKPKNDLVENLLDVKVKEIGFDIETEIQEEEGKETGRIIDNVVEEIKDGVVDSKDIVVDVKEKSLCDDNEVIEANSLKSISLQYTNIVPKIEGVYENTDFKCNFTHKHIENRSEGMENRLRTAIDFAMDVDKDNKRKVSTERQISVEDPVPSKKRKFACSLKRKRKNDLVENLLDVKDKEIGFDIETEIQKDDVVEENKKVVDSKDIVVDVKDKSVKDEVLIKNVDVINISSMQGVENDLLENVINSEIDKGCNFPEIIGKKDRTDEMDLGNEKKPIENITPKKNVLSLKRSLRKKLNANITLDMENKSNFVEEKGNVRIKNINKSKKTMEKFNKGVVDDGTEIDKRTVKNELGKGAKKSRNSKNKKKDKKDKKNKRRSNNKTILSELKSEKEVIDFTLNNDRELKLKYKNKYKKKMSIQNRNIKVKIKWKKEQFKLKITGRKEKRKKEKRGKNSKVLKQYVLKYSPEVTSPKEVIVKPESDIAFVKRKLIKTEKQGDNMKQTDISSFFKVSPKL